MFFEVTFPDGTKKTMQTHSRRQLEAALQNVEFIASASPEGKKGGVSAEKDQTLTCHGSARCEADQEVKHLNGTRSRETVHNIHLVQVEAQWHGFIKDSNGHRHGVMRVASEKAVWIEEY